MGAVENDEPPCAEVEGVVRAGKPQLLEGECLAEERIAFQPGVAKPPSPDVVVADAVVDGQRILRLKDSVEGVPLRLGALRSADKDSMMQSPVLRIAST